MDMSGSLFALVFAVVVPGWAAQVQSVKVSGQPGVSALPPMLAAPLAGPRLDVSAGQISLTGVLQGPGAAPALKAPAGLAAPVLNAVTPALPLLPAPAAAAGILAAPRVQTPAPAGAAAAQPTAPGANPGRTALERLSLDVPQTQPAPTDLVGQKSFADRSFDFKLGAMDADSAGATEAAVAAAPEDAGSGSIGRRKHKGNGKDQTPSTSDDGGGPDYPRGEVKFNDHTFPGVALRPNVPVEALLVEAIQSSKKSIRIALYEFKLRGVLAALQDAKRRGVKVEIVLDYSNVFPSADPDADYKPRRSPEIWGLLREGFEVNVLRGVSKYGILHNKFAVFDGKMVEFGSFNWSYTAEHSHYENALFSTQESRVQGYDKYWDYLKSLSVPFAQAKNHDWPKTVPLPPSEAVPSVEFNGVSLPSYMFMPDGAGFEKAVARAIDAAQESVDVAMFAVRSTLIAQALARARSRGLRVRAVLDESQSQSEYFGPYTGWLASQGIEVRVLAGPNPDSDFPMAEKTHHKFMVLDGKLVETGSANWTKRASMDNYENANFLDAADDVGAFAFAFGHMFSIARPYPKPERVPELPTDEALSDDILNPPADKPVPPAPEPPPIPEARPVPFHDAVLPSHALLPYQPIEPLYVKAIDAAQKSIRMALYEFTSEPILAALRRAKARGVQIEVVLDRAHIYTSGISHTGEPRKPKAQVVALAKEFSLKVLHGKSSGVMHNKFFILDDGLVSFGSYNLTDVAEKHHFENLMFSNDAKRVAAYRRYFEYMQGLAPDVDLDKLDEILNRTLESMTEAERTGEDSLEAEPEAEAARRPKFPPPPEDAEQPIRLNGESFPRQLFSPQGHIEETLVRAVKAAKTSIEIAMFSFYSQAIADALVEVRKAHPEVKIRLLMDFSQSKMAKLDEWFVTRGFDVRLLAGPAGDEGDPMFQKMHNKLMIIDGKLLETGSFNYSPNAENNSFENANFVDEPADLAAYSAYFARLWLQGWKAPAPQRKRSAAFAEQALSGSRSAPLWSQPEPVSAN